MEPIKLNDLMEAVSEVKSDVPVDFVSTDSRLCRPGSIFVAIRGENMDGHDFVNMACEKGAAAVVVDHDTGVCGCEQVIVSDTKDALIRMAGNYRARYNPRVIGVTGSVGKTTTKQMCGAICEAFGNTLMNEGNLNNEIGVPTTLFRMKSETELAVIEMGMCNLGEIRQLSTTVKPRVGIITAIGVSHLETLKTQENILKAKLEILDGMPSDGILVMNGDDPLLMGERGNIPIETATFAIRNEQADVVAKRIMSRGNSSEFIISDRQSGDFEAKIPSIGEHNILDALAAYTAATRLGLDPKKAAKALENYQQTGMRQKMVDYQGITVIEDCYNASPDSMKASLSMLSALPVEGIKVAVLGDMLELGEISEKEHRAIGMFAAKCGIDVLLCYGPQMKFGATAATAAGIACVAHFDEKDALAAYLKKTLHAGDAVIFKASRGMALEEIIHRFYEM